MEKDGMVAIVQGLKDAGLAVTLMNNSHLNSLKPRAPAPALPASTSSVETSTDAERFIRSTAAQVHNDHYTSSYQIAHCNIRPSSPPERLPEFPPQRLEPSRNQGNFQVGGFNSYFNSEENTFISMQAPAPAQPYVGLNYRVPMVLADRGLSGRLSPSPPIQNSDPFVHSLRRYPPSPERSVSAELVQRLLSYTQNKHLSKASRSRSLREESPTRDQKTDTSTKNIQTYTRTKNQCTRDCGANTHNDIRFGKKGRSFASTSPYCSRTKSEHHTATYDYLKPPRRGRCPEVRYLNDVKKCIRDTIKQMYDDKPVVCPQIKRRYSQHKKEHHKDSADNADVEDAAEASVGISTEPSLFTRCRPPAAVSTTCPKHLHCRSCGIPIICSCSPEFHEDDLTATSDCKDIAKCTLCKACACKETKDNKTEEEIFKWLKTLPVYADDSPDNKKKREDMVKDLADKLNGLKRDEDFEQKAKDEIKNCIEKLPMWYPGAKRDQEIFKNQIIDDLFNRLAAGEVDYDLKDTITQWIDDIQFEKDAEVDKDDIVRSLMDRLKPLIDNPDEMKSEIKDVLEDLPILNKKKVINKLADKLTDNLSEIADKTTMGKRISTDSKSFEEIENQIMEWLDEVPELSDDIKANKVMIKSLARKLKKVQEKGSDDEENQEKMKEEVVDWIEEILKSKGEKLDSQTKVKISNKLLDKLASAARFESQKRERKSSTGKEIDYEDQVWEWLDNVVDIPEGDKKSHQKLVKSFAKQLQELQSENADDEVIEEEIVDFLNSLSKKGVTVRNKDKQAKKLIDMIKSSPQTRKSSQDEELQQSILNEISDLVEDIPSTISKSKRNEIKDKVTNVLAKNINNLLTKTDNINREIVNILKKEAKMPENDAIDLASAIVNRVKGMPLVEKSKTSVAGLHMKTDNEVKQLVSDEVEDVLNDFNISVKKKKVLQKSITEVLADQIIRGTDKKKTKDDIISILQEANLSEDDVLDISNRLLERNNELSLSYNTRDSKLVICKPRLSGTQFISSEKRYEFEEQAEKEILDFIADVTGDHSPKTRKKRKEAVGHLVHRLGEIMSDPDDIDKEKSIIEEVSQYLEELSIDTDIPRDEMARQLANRLQGFGMQASTPKKDSFYPKRSSMDNMSSIHMGDNLTRNNVKSAQDIFDEEKKYMHELIQVIHSWMDELPVNLSATEDKGFKESMAEDLASDIVDRQKYIQINTDAKTSNEEELEHLKYQLFRWLNKFMDINDMTSIMQKTDSLMTKIKDVNVPVLVKPTRKRIASILGKDLIPDSMVSLKDEISMWMEEVPQNLYSSTDKDFMKQMINELAEKIHQFRVTNQSANINNEISNWLSKLLKRVDHQKLLEMTDSLESRLKQKGLTEASVMLDQDSSQFVEENLVGGIQDWMKAIPLFQKRTSIEKQELDGLIQELAIGLKSVFATTQGSVEDGDKMFIDEIRKHLEKFPLKPEQKSDPDFVETVATQLLRYLKDLQIFANISDRQETPVHGLLKENVEEWINSLPLVRINSSEKVQFENLKIDFMNKLKKIRQEDALNEQKIKDEIGSYLLRFPIEDNMKRDTKFINDKKEELHKKLLAVPVETYLESGSDKFVKKAVLDWMKTLPIDKTKTASDIPGDAIDELISTISNLIVKTDVIQIGEIKKTLQDATEKFLKSVPLDPSTHIDVETLADTLFKIVKDMSRRRSSIAKPPTIKKAADILFDNIEDWVDNLPFKGDTPEEVEKAKKVKQEIASKLIHKIGELNMNPEVFNDDFLYDNMLEDEIDNLLTDLSSEDIRNNLPAIKKDLMEKVKEARQKTQEEVAGQAYKQQLREAISKTLPSEPLTPEEQATFEVLKDNLADAFITLHYVGDDEELKTKYKTKINEEVSKFCNDYLKKHPTSPIDSKKLNQDLYNALKGVPIPKEETVRNEVELVKIKDEVNDWIKELPLADQTAAEKMQTTKMVAVLAKKLHDIEKQKELAPDDDYDDKMRKEINKWVKKLQLDINDEKAAELTEKLVTNLKNTEKSRRVSASTRHSIGSDVFDMTSLTPGSSATKTCKICKPPGISLSRYSVPPSTLSFEEQQHLQKIRERSAMPRCRYSISKDAAVSPLPIDAGSQTEMRPCEQHPCGKRLSQQSSGVQTLRPPEEKSMQAVGSQAEVTPHVIVKEYYWDPADAVKMGVCGPQFSPIQIVPQKPPEVCPPRSSQFTTPPQMWDKPSQGTCSQRPRVSPQASPMPCQQTPTPQPRRKEWDQPCSRREVPEADEEPCASRSFRSPRARVTRLGSFDDVETKCPSRHDWSKFEDDFWGERRSDDDDFLKERKKEEEKVRCRCRERIFTKCCGKRRGRGCSQSSDDVKMCSKCCGVHCPYPSYLYFRQ